MAATVAVSDELTMRSYLGLAETGGTLARATSGTQFALSAVFTPENALHLWGIAAAYQEGSGHGRLSMLEVAKGRFFPGHEQDAAIAPDPFISQQIGLWGRRGVGVTRGHTNPLGATGSCSTSSRCSCARGRIACRSWSG